MKVIWQQNGCGTDYVIRFFFQTNWIFSCVYPEKMFSCINCHFSKEWDGNVVFCVQTGVGEQTTPQNSWSMVFDWKEHNFLYVMRTFLILQASKGRHQQKKNVFFRALPESPNPPPTLGQNRSFWLLKTSLIFQGISWDLDVNVLKHITMKILLQIKRYFKFVLWVI